MDIKESIWYKNRLLALIRDNNDYYLLCAITDCPKLEVQEETETINNMITFTKSISGEINFPLVVGNNNSILNLIKLQDASEYEKIVSILKALL